MKHILAVACLALLCLDTAPAQAAPPSPAAVELACPAPSVATALPAVLGAALSPVPVLSALAVAQAPVVIADPAADPFALLSQIVDAGKAHNWLGLVPLILIGLIAVARLYLSKKWVWFASDQGGAVLALAGIAAETLAAAALVPGAHTASQVLIAALGALLTNQLLFSILKKLIAGGSGTDAAAAVAKAGQAAGAAATASAEAGAQATKDAFKS